MSSVTYTYIIQTQVCTGAHFKDAMYVKIAEATFNNTDRVEWGIQTLVEYSSCMSIKGVQQATDDVTPRRHDIVGRHKVKCKKRKKYSSIACRMKIIRVQTLTSRAQNF